jgi:N-methylhydantoinase A/oxoprolinase/acetone carboxylase beta subunit
MFAEGVDLAECECIWQIQSEDAGADFFITDPRNIALPTSLQGRELSLGLKVVKKLDHFSFTPVGDETASPAVSSGSRKIMLKPGEWREIPVYRLEDQSPGGTAVGPAIIEEEYFTGKIDEHWRFYVSSNRDVVIEKI